MPRKKKKGLALDLRPETVMSLAALVMIALGLLVIVSFTGQGALLSLLNTVLAQKLGAAVLFLPFVLISCGLVLLQTKWMWSKPHVVLGTILLMVGFLGTFQTGEVGQQSFTNLAALIAPAGSYVVFITLLLAGILVLAQLSIAEVLEFAKRVKPPALSLRRSASEESEEEDRTSLFEAKEPEAESEEEGEEEASPEADESPEPEEESQSGFVLPKLPLPFFDSVQTVAAAAPEPVQSESAPVVPKKLDKPLVPRAKSQAWEYPSLELLSDAGGGEANRGDVKQNAHTIEGTLESFGIKARVAEVNYGPSVTQYGIEIARGTKLSRITGLATDLALALAAPGGQIRIEAPIAGRSLVGIEVPNYSPQYVTLRQMLTSPLMKKHPSKLATALGINVAGKPVIMDIAKMPHVLIAGSTGSGKSVAMNTFLCSLLFRASPAELKLILVDPKRVEMTGYNDIPHLLTPVIVEPKKVVSALKWATHEMDQRYKKLAEVGVRNITAYNELAGHAAMPNIVIFIDELADIMLFAPSEVEESITRIAQMARAVGIHLVLATQRPSVDVITGLIKANIPARIAFNVTSATDSRVILDSLGAEKLLGKGDMLFIPPDQPKPMRVQGTYVSDQEIKGLIDFIKAQGQTPEYEEEVTSKYKADEVGASGSASGADGQDDLYVEVAKFVAQSGKASSSSIQRRFSVGYNRAARILDQLHEMGLVGPQDGSKPREVNITAVMELLRRQETGRGDS